MGAGADGVAALWSFGGWIIEHTEYSAGGAAGLIVPGGEIGWVGDLEGGAEEVENISTEGVAGYLEPSDEI